MLTLPPPKSGARLERRSGDRRAGDRRAAKPAKAEGPDAVPPAEEPARPSATKRDPRRRGGRRAEDRAQAFETASETAPEAFVRAPRPHAPLVAQIIATVLGVEQTRVRRRGTLEQAEALYGKQGPRPQRSRGEA